MWNCGYTREPSLRLDNEFMIDENGLAYASKATKFRKEILCAVRVNRLKESVGLTCTVYLWAGLWVSTRNTCSPLPPALHIHQNVLANPGVRVRKRNSTNKRVTPKGDIVTCYSA